jgi:hypothetical protein
MKNQNIFEELREKYADEDRAKLVMLQVRKLMAQKQAKKWYQKFLPRIKTEPKIWRD